MKTRIHKTFGLFAIILALVSCSKDDSDSIVIEDEVAGTLLLIEEKVNGQPMLKFEYDDRNRVVLRKTHLNGSLIETQAFSYDDSNRLIGVTGSSGLKETYSYKSGSQPTSGQWIDDSNTTAIQFTYSDDMVIETHSWDDKTLIFTYKFDRKGNLITFRTNAGGQGESITKFGDYDDKASCYTHYPWSWKIGYANNYQSVKITGAGAVLVNQTLEYTYNDAGYPVKANVYNKESGELFETREYIYKKAN